LLDKSEDEEIEEKEMNDVELADLFAGLFSLKD
jgi:hypothetical protein